MLGELVTLPLRLSARAGSFALRATERVAETAFMTADAVLRRFRSGDPDRPASGPAADAAAESTPRARARSSSRNGGPAGPGTPAGTQRRGESPVPSDPRREVEPDPTVPPPSPPTAEEALAGHGPDGPSATDAPSEPSDATPAHVSEEPELVEEVADPGAEDGAGAQITVDEPWDGYAQLTAQDVIDRLAAASPEELAAVQLYESTHRSRRTVLDAVEKKLTTAQPPAND